MRYVYAIGDVHGRLDLLERAIDAIRAHATGHLGAIICLGDYVDRGPDSCGVVERLMVLGRGVTCLMGNHEALLVEAYRTRSPSALERWLENGGLRTLMSYGWTDGEFDLDIIPEAHVAWMEKLPIFTADDHRIYVHAGLLPGLDMDEQDEFACLWVRERFLMASAKELPAHVVHGHTPVWKGKPDPQTPELLAHRTNLDTAAYATGRLCVGVFDAAEPGPPVDVIEIEGEPGEAALERNPAARAELARRIESDDGAAWAAELERRQGRAALQAPGLRRPGPPTRIVATPRREPTLPVRRTTPELSAKEAETP